MLDYEKLSAFIKEYNEHYRELLDFETKKFSIIATDNIDELAKSLSREQALVMKSTAFEKRRIDILGEDVKKRFPDIIDESPEKYRGQLTSGYNELKRLVTQIKRINDSSREIVSQRLSLLEDVRNGFVNSYGGDGKKLRAETSSTLDRDI